MSSIMTATFMFALMVVPIAGLVVSRVAPDYTADQFAAAGADCGKTNSVLGKWKKSKNVGTLIGTARAAVSQAQSDSVNIDAALTAAEELGESVGRDGTIPKSVSDAVATANLAKGVLDGAESALETSTDTMKGNIGNFAEDVTDAAMVNLKKLIQDAQLASVAAQKEVVRVNEKAAKAKADTMKSSAGALRLIKGMIDEMQKLNVTHKSLDQKTDFAVTAVLKAAQDWTDAPTRPQDLRNANLTAKIAAGGAQTPVWNAYQHDLTEQVEALRLDRVAVNTARTDFNGEMTTMTVETDALKAVVNASQSSLNAALGQTELIDAGEASIRAYAQKKALMIAKVVTMQKSSARYAKALKNVRAKLTASPVGDAFCDTFTACTTERPIIDLSGSKQCTGACDVDTCCKVTGKCTGNTGGTGDVVCTSGVNKGASVDGTTAADCCVVSGKCTGNTDGTGDVTCPAGAVNKGASVVGTTAEKCCNVNKCTGNTGGAQYVNVTCQAGEVNKGASANGTTPAECCEAAPTVTGDDTCDSFNAEGCSATSAGKIDNAALTSCTGTCDADTCCKAAAAATCVGFTCTGGLMKVPSPESVECTGAEGANGLKTCDAAKCCI